MSSNRSKECIYNRIICGMTYIKSMSINDRFLDVRLRVDV